MYEVLTNLRSNLKEPFFLSYERVKRNFARYKKIVKEGVRIRCPFSMSRMKIPIRGDKCEHIECFDGESYYWLN